MPKPWEQYQSTPSQEGPWTQYQQTQTPSAPAQTDQQPVEESPGVFDIFTGESRQTPEIEGLQEIGAADELNELSMRSLKSSLGLLSTGDDTELRDILKKQLGDDVTFTDDSKGNTIVNLPSGKYVLNAPGLSGQDVVRGAFDALAFTPAARAGSIAKAAGGAALTEAAIEGTEEALGGEFDTEDVAAAGVLGGFFKGAEDLVGAGYRAIKGSKGDDIVEAGRQADIPVLTTDALPPETFAGKIAAQSGEKIPVVGTGGIREGQQKAREEAVGSIAEKYGQFSYPAIIDSLKNQKNKVKQAAGNVLNTTGQKLDDVGSVDYQGTMQAIDSAVETLGKKGVLKSEGALGELQLLAETLKEAPQTFTTLKENRTLFREIVKGADRAERSQLSSRAKGVLQGVENAIKKDMNAHAKANLTPKELSKWNKANAVYAEEAQKLTKTRLKNVLDKGDATPESVQTLLFSKRPSEVKNLYNSLTPEGRSNARSAVISKVFDTLGRRAGGITPNTFVSEMKKQGLQIDTFFKGEEKQQLNGLIKVLDATRRAQDASVTTPTGQSLIGVGTAYSAFTDLFATGGTLATMGGLSRAYESVPVRNALIRLASIPKGSTRFEQALKEAQQALSTSAQTLRE